jgi:hypothetical protein
MITYHHLVTLEIKFLQYTLSSRRCLSARCTSRVSILRARVRCAPRLLPSTRQRPFLISSAPCAGRRFPHDWQAGGVTVQVYFQRRFLISMVDVEMSFSSLLPLSWTPRRHSRRPPFTSKPPRSTKRLSRAPLWKGKGMGPMQWVQATSRGPSTRSAWSATAPMSPIPNR